LDQHLGSILVDAFDFQMDVLEATWAVDAQCCFMPGFED